MGSRFRNTTQCKWISLASKAFLRVDSVTPIQIRTVATHTAIEIARSLIVRHLAFFNRSMISISIGIFVLSLFAGCRRAAYTELYVENMAAENRALEDRVYEYDAAYQSVSQDLDDLKRAHEQLKRKYNSLKDPDSNSYRNDKSLLRESEPKVETAPLKQGKPKSGASSKPKSLSDLEEDVLVPQSIPATPPPLHSQPDGLKLGPGEEKRKENEKPAPASEERSASELLPGLLPGGTLPSPSAPSGIPQSNKPNTNNQGEVKDNSELLPPPAGSNRSLIPDQTGAKNSLKRKASDLVEDYDVPRPLIRSAQQPRFPESPNVPSGSIENEREIPTPDRKLLPPPLPPKSNSLPLQGKIKLPVDPNIQLAAANIALNSEVKVQADGRIMEIGFHPTLCRGHNFDDKPGDDGLYLVLVPRDEFGKSYNVNGNVTIVVEETVQNQTKRIGAWEIPASTLDEFLEPIGSSQGYHLSLPWQGTVPQQNVVQVFVKYELEDGRVLVNRKEIHLRKPGARQSTWTPR